MGYLIGQILLCLLAAALIGLFVGWWFTREWSRYRLSDVQVSIRVRNGPEGVVCLLTRASYILGEVQSSCPHGRVAVS